MTTISRNVRTTFEMIRIEHTLFALPFALLGAILASNGLPDPVKLLWITVAMFGARSAAMTFNRIVDRHSDAANPRTSSRALPSGALSVRFAWATTIVSAGIFVVAAAMLNRMTLLLSPVALLSVTLYSYTKRFTSLSHIVLGWCLAIAPTAAWIAVRGSIDSPAPLLLSAVVLLWTAGFDILYACQDAEFDRGYGLHSIPAMAGVRAALWISKAIHLCAFVALLALLEHTGVNAATIIGVIATGALLVYQHSLIAADDLSRLNAAFFTTNATISIILLVSFGGASIYRGL